MAKKLKDEISRLLKKYYPPDSQELKLLRLSRHAGGIAKVTQDPLLWVRLIHGNEVVEAYALAQTVESKLLKDAEGVVKKRMGVLETCCQGKPDLASLSSNYNKLFENALQHEDAVVVKSVDADGTLESSNGRDIDDSERVLRGVVVDIYLTPSKQWVAYVSLPNRRAAQLADVFEFDNKALAESWCTPYPLHIGDAAEFSVNSASGTNEVQNCTMRIVEYPPAISLDETFIQHYFSRIKQFSSESSLPILLLQPPAPWKSFLNEKAIYSNYYREILALCFSFSQPNVAESPVLPLELTRIVGGSSFIREVPNLLKQDPRQNCDEVTTECKSYRRDVHAAIHLLITLTKHSPDYAYQIADAFKSLVRLSQGKFREEIQSIILALVDTYLTPDSPVVQMPELPSIEHSGESVFNTTQDPLFWVRLLYNGSIEKSCYLTAVSASNNVDEKVVAKRQEMLETYSLVSLDVAKLESQLAPAQVEQLKAACPQKIDLKNVTEIAESSNSALQGVVIDIYPAPASASKVEGYIAVCPDAKHGQDSAQSNCHVYKFDSSTPILMPTGGCLLPLHIGDTIAFKPADGSEVGTILEVVEYCPHALSKEFAAHYFSYIKPAEGVEALLRVLESPAPWKGILNNPALYQEYCGSILTVYNACNSTDTAAIPDATKKLAHTFKRCSFIQNLPTVLDQDVGKAEMTDQYLSKVRIAVNLLNRFVQHLSSEAKTVAEVLKHMGKMLSSVTMYPEFQSLTLSLIGVCLAPPASLALNERPWRTIPTLLTEQEFEISAGSPIAMEENPNLPKVKESGRYNSIDEYGRTYFTLLRADCYGELIDTVARLKLPNSRERQDIFYRVKFVHLGQGSDRHIVYAFHFEAHLPLGKSQDSILTQGNLMCFSIGGRFERDLVWGTVDGIDEVSGGVIDESGKEVVLKEGKMYVQLWSEANSYQDEEVMVLLKQSENVVAVESPAYFRAYHPVLEALKNLELDRVHFRDDLLHPGAEVKSKPEILSDNTKVDPRPVYKTSCEYIPEEMTVRQLKEALLDTDEDSSQLCLDLSQREAIYNALVHPLTVIQGPPGTGKTFIAIKLLNIFLSMNTLPNDKPILVMAYKNRALDHFIHGCVSPSPSGSSVCKLQDIVRIGHTSEGYGQLEDTLLSKKVNQAMFRRSRIEHLQKLRSLYKRIQQASENLHKRGKLTLQNCLSSITPEWLKSILLEAPPQLAGQLSIPQDLKLKLQCDPKRFLDLLKEEGIMGWQDDRKRKAVNTALREAWKVWTADLELQLEFPSSSTRRQSTCQPSSDCGESVEDFAQLQQERRMATDNFDEQENGSKDSLEANLIDLAVNQDMKIADYHTHVWDLSPGQRKQLILSAVIGRYSDALDNMQQSLKEYNKTLESYEWKRQAESLRILRRAKVVAMTTTGAAIHQQLLNKLEAPVMFVEEAAEVLESNLLACLTPHVKHLVLIGDHKQLKPKVACWKLAKYHRFNTSLFERLVNNNFPYTILMRQNRMHPNLVRLFAYHYTLQKKEAGHLKSTKRTREYYHPPCMARQFFWWSYTEHLEEKRGGVISNPYEVRMVIALCIWLLSQTTDCKITILTPYRAQLKRLQDGLSAKANQLTIKELQSSVLVGLATIPVLTVDEFQGHESDVIILSLVRSNTKKLLGFLKERNRLVVGTSREKCAFYIIGNAEFLGKNSPFLWKDFIQRLKKEDIGDAVPVKQHGKLHDCTTPEDLETRAYERQESTPDLTESDGPVRNEPRRTSSQSQIDEPAGRELLTCTDDTPVAVHCQETTTPGTTANPFGTQRQESASDMTDPPTRVHVPQPLSSPQRASSLGEEPTGKVEVTYRQQSSPAVLQAEDQRENRIPRSREKKFCRCCILLQRTDAVNEWKDIGRYLDVSNSTVDRIKHEEKQVKEQFFQMMMGWWREKGADATPERLTEALQFANLLNVTNEVDISW